ncbi:hypothetical protein WY02_08445 [Pseudonocardia sp. AL041005-10]|nr:hypothetical protein WY02_08445 [Pseudonocardia sp. AL041005-10]
MADPDCGRRGALVVLGLFLGALMPMSRDSVGCGSAWFPRTTGAPYIEEYCADLNPAVGTIAAVLAVLGVVLLLVALVKAIPAASTGS